MTLVGRLRTSSLIFGSTQSSVGHKVNAREDRKPRRAHELKMKRMQAKLLDRKEELKLFKLRNEALKSELLSEKKRLILLEEGSRRQLSLKSAVSKFVGLEMSYLPQNGSIKKKINGFETSILDKISSILEGVENQLLKNATSVQKEIVFCKAGNVPLKDSSPPTRQLASKLQNNLNTLLDSKSKLAANSRLDVRNNKSVIPVDNYLCVCAMFKNEADGMREWLSHYKDQGVDKFILINNESTDNWEERIKNLPFRKDVSIANDGKKWAQDELYNKYCTQPLKQMCTWALVVDLDEFAYARNGFTRLADFLRTVPPDISRVSLPWKSFGSNDRIQQPSSIVQGFTKRKKMQEYPSHLTLSGKATWLKNVEHGSSAVKSFVRTSVLKSLWTHHHCVSSGACQEIPHKRSEMLLALAPVHLNHYRIQSWEWFKKVKMARGDSEIKRREDGRNRDYFLACDKGANIDDVELKDHVNELRLHRQQWKNDSIKKAINRFETSALDKISSVLDEAMNGNRSWGQNKFKKEHEFAWGVSKCRTDVKPNQLCVCSVFRNEAVAIREWLIHYRDQGVDDFTLINNESTDNWEEKIKDLPFRKHVHVVDEFDRHEAQDENYNRYCLKRFKEMCDWGLVVDLDEFAYARKGFARLTDFLQTVPPDVDQVSAPWKIFGSSGYIQQPPSIVQHLTKRQTNSLGNVKALNPFMSCPYKSFVRTSGLIELRMHKSKTRGGRITHLPKSEMELANVPVHINHYRIQSWERFNNIKMSRRGNKYRRGQNLTDPRWSRFYFISMDHGAVLSDTELKDRNRIEQRRF